MCQRAGEDHRQYSEVRKRKPSTDMPLQLLHTAVPGVCCSFRFVPVGDDGFRTENGPESQTDSINLLKRMSMEQAHVLSVSPPRSSQLGPPVSRLRSTVGSCLLREEMQHLLPVHPKTLKKP